MVGNHSQSVKAEGSLTARATTRAGTKVGLSDLVVLHGKAITQRIKATLGITGLSPPRVHIDGEVWHLDEELSLVREDRDGRTAGVPVVPPGASLGSYVRKG